eukprot:TRINITY_DN111_c0_g7_i1.p1 TRINITY_DN111_c0_g7~~TRINITY_DN111_c0_g7_i1.p1  ORF type:complete len:175 (+),score=58.14 TRINITY_DN111_c0_g7_i1:160-684(+)
MSLLLCYHAFWIPLLEVIEVAGGWWFHYTYSDLSQSSALMVVNMVWLVLATLNLLVKRVLVMFVWSNDVTSYASIVRRFGASREVLQREGHTEAEAANAFNNLKMIAIPPQWAHWVLSVANVIIIGIAHIEHGITAASATSQVPSWFIMCWAPYAHFKFNRAKWSDESQSLNAP